MIIGQKHTEESRKRISLGNKGKVRTKEQVERLRQGQLKRVPPKIRKRNKAIYDLYTASPRRNHYTFLAKKYDLTREKIMNIIYYQRKLSTFEILPKNKENSIIS